MTNCRGKTCPSFVDLKGTWAKTPPCFMTNHHFISFHAPAFDGMTGAVYLSLLANAFAEQGFVIDYKGRIESDDWWFRASRGGWTFFVFLVMVGEQPESIRWFIGLDRDNDQPLDSPEIREAVNPTLERVVRMIPLVSHIRWHADWTTLREV